jgi:hypothetical protein
MATNCSYGPNGTIPRDASFASGLRSKSIIGCAGKFADIEANTALVNDQVKALEVIDGQNVKYYGAKGDGVTDDSAAIQAALDANAGGCVFFGQGTFVIGTPLVPATNTTIDGCGAFLLMTDANTAARVFTISNANVTVKDLLVYYTGANTTTSVAFYVAINNFSLFDVRGSLSDNNVAQFIQVQNTTSGQLRINIHDCLLIARDKIINVVAGIAPTVEIIAVGNRFNLRGNAVVTAGISLIKATNGVFANNVFQIGTGTTVTTAIDMDVTSVSNVFDTIFKVEGALTNRYTYRPNNRYMDGPVLLNLPVASAGLPTGALWNNAGVVNVV